MKKIEMLFLCFTFIFITMFAHPRLTYEFSTPKYFFLVIFAVALMVLFIVRKLMEKDRSLYLAWPHLGYFLFGASAVVASFAMLRENALYFPYPFELGMYALLTVFFSVYLSNFFEEKKEILFFLTAVLIAGFFVAVEALMNYYDGQSFFLGGFGGSGKMQMKATIGNPNFVSDFLASLIPIAIYFAISNQYGFRNKSDSVDQKRFFFILGIKTFGVVCFFLFYLVVLLAGTRAVYLALMGGFLIFGVLVFWYRKRIFLPSAPRTEVKEKNPKKKTEGKQLSVKPLSLIALGAVVVILLFLPVILSLPGNFLGTRVDALGRVATSFETRGFQITGGKGRLLSWAASIYQWKDYPLTGNGLGTYKLKDGDYLAQVMEEHPEYIDVWNNYKRTHNDYLQVLGEMGLFGFLTMSATILLLIVLFFQMLKRMKNGDDILLFLLFAVCFFEILGHSATEFPLQMLPNQLWAIVLASVGFGPYFNREKRMAKTVSIKKHLWLAALAAVLGIGLITGYLKYHSLFAEVFFKDGNTYYSYLSQVDSAQADLANKEQEYLALQGQLEHREGNYAGFNPDVYMQKKLAGQNVSAMSPIALSQLKIKILGDLEKEVDAEKQKLASIFSQIENKKIEYQGLSQTYYLSALDSFEKSIGHLPAFGKSFFYIALIMVRPERKEAKVSEFNQGKDHMSVLSKHFVTDTEEVRHILPEYRDRLLEEDFSVFSGLIKAGVPFQDLVDGFKLSLWYDIQMNQDSLDYFETSLKVFSEKNTFRIMGKSCLQIISYLRELISAYRVWAERNPEYATSMQRLIVEHEKQIKTKIVELQTWMDTALYTLPGSWHLFPDWENVYQEYITMLLKLGTPAEYYGKIKEIVEKRIHAVEYTHRAQQLAVPSEISNLYRYMIQHFHDQQKYQEALILYKEVVDMLKDPYEWNRVDLTHNPYLDDSGKAKIQSFLQDYERLEGDFSQYYHTLQNHYQAMNDQGMFDQYLLPDWRSNELTGETWEDPTYETVQLRMTRLAETDRQ
ncbi:MAG TPA: O-antigen ligase [Thermotogota bacterium]|nr:O-antigen ligase family protein [Thermotogota bacterium]NLH19017.1 O-antigen ligase family protein [Thermotogaceae bacterium]OQC32358.1 MAG: O-Antigen ligase [Thermotogota bacterium ADurb.Bin062]HNW46264.1 O-antigen ligase [Thermotogota bacterium]HNY82686.1 O-antigen ligase [Thermotogota bacterium]